MAVGYYNNCKAHLEQVNVTVAAASRGANIDQASIRRMINRNAPSRDTTVRGLIIFLNNHYKIGLIFTDEFLPEVKS